MEKEHTFLKSFGKLLRRLRGITPVEQLAERIGVSAEFIVNVETAVTPIGESTARYFLKHGFGLDQNEVKRLILGIRLYDLGLRDNIVRQFVEDVILKTAPPDVQAELRRLYRSYSEWSAILHQGRGTFLNWETSLVSEEDLRRLIGRETYVHTIRAAENKMEDET
jgi:hypothetical protein